MDFRQTPTINGIVAVLTPESNDFNEALAKVTAEVVFNRAQVHLFDYIEANKVQTMLIGRWAAEVAVMTAALPTTWDLTELTESYNSMTDPLTLMSYFALWTQIHGEVPDMDWIPKGEEPEA